MLRNTLAYLSLTCFGACAPALADGLPAHASAASCAPVVLAKHATPRFARYRYVRRPTSEIAQIRVDGCWQYQPVFNAAGEFYGRQFVKLCIDLPPN